MCGIAGYLSYGKKIDDSILNDMCQALSHRGPDAQGVYYHNFDDTAVAMGHRRLSIIDLSEGGIQPMHFNGWHIIFNGEIYNYESIRDTLIKEGYVFNSNSDTEVILKAFDKWDVKCVERFIGMFSFVILNDHREKIYCFRDRAGVKPFYYYATKEEFVWASELKSIHKYPDFMKALDYDALQMYLGYGYVPTPHTIFKNCFKLNPGHYLEIDLKSFDIKEIKYWDVYDFYSKSKNSISEDAAIKELEELVTSSCNYRMVSDVPVGVFLSGGIDSSVVTAILQKGREEKIKTFTIGFKEKQFDEAPYAKVIAEYLGTDHHELYCTEAEAKEVVALLPTIYDEPCGDSSAIPTYLVSKMAKKHVTVALSADGGDETFFGYNHYPAIIGRLDQFKKMSSVVKFAAKISIPLLKLVFRNDFQKVRKLSMFAYALKSNNLNAMDFSTWWNRRFDEKSLAQLLVNPSRNKIETFFSLRNDKTANIEELDQLLAIDYKTVLVDDLLTKVDRATMAVSLEGREPLLDHRLIEFAASLPVNLKYKNGVQKYLLKEIAYKYIPKKLLDRPKLGFSIPLKHWFRDDMRYLLDEYLNAEYLDRQGIFKSAYVRKLLHQYYSGKDDVFEQIWFLLMFQMWFKKWME